MLIGWFFTKSLFIHKEQELLDKKGTFTTQDLGSILQSGNTSTLPKNKVPTDVKTIPKKLSEDEIGQILAVWKGNGQKYPHDPHKDQITMEQAIDAGKKWLTDMAEKDLLPFSFNENHISKTNAKLYTIEGGEDCNLPYALLGCWQVTFHMNQKTADLLIHAVSGQVWEAALSIDEKKVLESFCKEEDIIQAAFPFLHMDPSYMMTSTENYENILFMQSQTHKIYAALQKKWIAIATKSTTGKYKIKENRTSLKLHIKLWLDIP